MVHRGCVAPKLADILEKIAEEQEDTKEGSDIEDDYHSDEDESLNSSDSD